MPVIIKDKIIFQPLTSFLNRFFPCNFSNFSCMVWSEPRFKAIYICSKRY